MSDEPERTYTQEELNRVIAEARRTDRAEIERLTALRDRQPEQPVDDTGVELEAIRAQTRESEAQIAEYEKRESAYEREQAARQVAQSVAKGLGYPGMDAAFKLAKFLEGDTREEMAHSARLIFEEFRPEGRPTPWGVLNDRS